jgi:hypothetical protein
LRRSAKKELLTPKNILSRPRRRNVFAKIVKEPIKITLLFYDGTFLNATSIFFSARARLLLQKSKSNHSKI